METKTITITVQVQCQEDDDLGEFGQEICDALETNMDCVIKAEWDHEDDGR